MIQNKYFTDPEENPPHYYGLQTMYKPHKTTSISHVNINLQKRSHEGFKAWLVELD